MARGSEARAGARARLGLPRSLRILALLSCLLCAGSCKRGPATESSAAEPDKAAPADPALPGLGPADDAVQARLRQAIDGKGADYQPRTEHKRKDGSAKYVNRLILETSPYLLQHAHNPVNWFSWGEEAFARAQAENKPVLLSVGYSTCHWCHVMERESFEDEEVAAFINQRYIPIKVDREERPDIDGIYMAAVLRLAGRGGWPMTVVLTPDKDPFFGGTYFPARDGDRGSRKGFLTILKELAEEYATTPEAVVSRAQTLSQQIRGEQVAARSGAMPSASALVRVFDGARKSFDPKWGGFGRAPKFPRPAHLELLLRYHRRSGEEQAKAMVETTLEKMADGGIFDQVGGGFHRYSVDHRWLVPHFEKMLYDNAQLVPVYLSAYQLSGRERFAEVARQTLDYVAREMVSPQGAFYSATDADSVTPGGHLEEGYFFTWTLPELRALLSPGELAVVRPHFGISPKGNFEGRTILFRNRKLPALVAAHKSNKSSTPRPTEAQLQGTLERAVQKLYAARGKREAPLLDDKILTAWNGLMISAFARGALVLNVPAYAQVAQRAAEYLLKTHRKADGRLWRSSRDGKPRHGAYSDDYAFLIQGLLDLWEATSEPRWLTEAQALQQQLDAHHWDTSGGGYTLTPDDHEELLVKTKPIYDGAEPSGNSVAALNLFRLAEITLDDSYAAKGDACLRAFAADLTRRPGASPKLLSALEYRLDEPLSVFIVVPKASEPNAAHALLDVMGRSYAPNTFLVVAAEGERLRALTQQVPALEGKHAQHGKATAYVCRRGACKLPTSNPVTLRKQLSAVVPL